jgi:ribosome-associated heat shock protein Hsp15
MMSRELTKVRIDKWLWAVRLYKTRSQAASAIDEGRVKINDETIKASHLIKIGEVYRIRHQHIMLTVKVIALLDKRVAAPLVKEYMEDLTPPEERNKKREVYFFPTGKGWNKSGRPTKKNRRLMDGYFGIDHGNEIP